ncbi:MAG: RlmE family RNA methyltransferase [Desulfobacteraceae bacterium]|jgi:23S rRNA (uridine2552-2'-O)-methyltransferase
MKKHSKQKANRWADHYTRKAQKEKFPARSVYKLQEMQRRFRLIKKGDRVLDLGCAPGSWLKFTAEQIGGGGQVVGVDLKPVTIALPPKVQVIKGDAFQLTESLAEAIGTDYNLILSDMAPATSGNKFVDGARSYELCRQALDLAQKLLLPGGRFACKIFQGEDFNEFVQLVKTAFGRHKIFKPESSRKASKEIFVLGFDKQ